MVRQAVVLLMASLLTVPAWPGANPVGFVDSTKNATLSGVEAVGGSTVFENDGVKVLSGGSLSVVLTGGSRALFGPGTDANLARNGAQVAVNLERGLVLLTTAAKSPVAGLVVGVTFRPAAADRPSVGWLELRKGHMVLYADKGDWLVNTGDDGRTVLLHQGNRLEGSVTSVGQGNDREAHNKKKRKLAAFWISAGLAGLAAGLATGLNPTAFVDCVDPVQPVSCGPSVASPVVP